MDQVPKQRPGIDRSRLAALILLWIVFLGTAAAWGEDGLERAVAAGRGRLDEAAWAAPLAFGIALTALTSPRVIRRWPRLGRRILLASAVFVLLFGLIFVSGPAGAFVILILAAIAVSLAYWALVLPHRLAPALPAEVVAVLDSRDRIELTDARLKLQNDLRTTALQTIAGVALLATAVIGFQQLAEDRQQATATQELARRGQSSERFTRAIDQLGSDRRETQLGGIFGLEQIAQQSPGDRLAVTEVLVAYLHRRSPGPSAQPGASPARPATPSIEAGTPRVPLRVRAPEVQATVTVLARRTTEFLDPPLDLTGLDLAGAEISGRTYVVGSKIRLHAADLQGADFTDTDLRGATFESAYLGGARFEGADLRDADFSGIAAALGQSDSFPARPDDAWDSGIDEAHFPSARANGTTRWPTGFDWRAAGITSR